MWQRSQRVLGALSRPRLSVWHWVGIALLAIAVVWRVGHHSVCQIPLVTHATNGGQSATCLEFWLNRYQTLIGSLTAVGAAAGAWLGVQRQILYTHTLELKKYLYNIRYIRTLNKRVINSLLTLINDEEICKDIRCLKKSDDLKEFIDAYDQKIKQISALRSDIREIYRKTFLEQNLYVATEDLRSKIYKSYRQAKELNRLAKKLLTSNDQWNFQKIQNFEITERRQTVVRKVYQDLLAAKINSFGIIEDEICEIERKIRFYTKKSIHTRFI